MHALIVIVAFLPIAWVIWLIWKTQAFKRLGKARAGKGFAEFRASFDPSEVPEPVQRQVFDYIQKKWADDVKGFAVEADDVLKKVYSQYDDDVETAILALSIRCDKKKPDLDQMEDRPRTVRDLARLIARLP